MKAVKQEFAAAARGDVTAGLAAAIPTVTAQLRPGDLESLQNVPDIGDVVLAQLIAYAHDGLVRWDRRCFAGVAPVTRQFGRQCRGRMCRAASKPPRNATHHMAGTAVLHNRAGRNYHDSMRDRDIRHGHALRVAPGRLRRIAFTMLRDGTEFDPHRPTR